MARGSHEELSEVVVTTNPVKRHGGRSIARVLVATAAVAAFAGGMGAVASAAPGDTDPGTTNANVNVSSTITMSGLTPTFSINGISTATVTANGAVTMKVTTANLAGYTVTVQAATPTLVAQSVANTDSIPIGALKVRESAAGNTGAFTSLSDTATVLLYSQSGRSVAAGDNLSNDYQIAIPFVADDTYSATLDYIATAT